MISAIKRVLDESVRDIKPHSAFIEVATKITAYNHYLGIEDAVIKSLGGNSIAERLEFG